jgi:hypothetical protein
MAKRKRVARGTRIRITPAEWMWMTGERREDANAFETLMLRYLGIRDSSLIEHERQVWAEYRQEALRIWPRLYPGTRPEAWWYFDAPADRFRVIGQEQDVLGLEVDITESETAFLARHRVLSAGERRRLSDDAFEPVGDGGPKAADIMAWRLDRDTASNVVAIDRGKG